MVCVLEKNLNSSPWKQGLPLATVSLPGKTGLHILITPFQSSCHGSVETNLTSINEDAGLIPGLAQWVKDLALP